ncbi:uncharacterized protein LOC144928854 [Branchiostoma floridae x Branchiostoma belcheri]
MEGENERVKIPPRKMHRVHFGGSVLKYIKDLQTKGNVFRAYGKLRQYLTMFLCVLWDLSVFLSIFLMTDLSAILCTCPIQGGFAYCGTCTYLLEDKRTSDLDRELASIF